MLGHWFLANRNPRRAYKAVRRGHPRRMLPPSSENDGCPRYCARWRVIVSRRGGYRGPATAVTADHRGNGPPESAGSQRLPRWIDVSRNRDGTGDGDDHVRRLGEDVPEWYRSYGNELWEFDDDGYMRRRRERSRVANSRRASGPLSAMGSSVPAQPAGERRRSAARTHRWARR